MEGNDCEESCMASMDLLSLFFLEIHFCVTNTGSILFMLLHIITLVDQSVFLYNLSDTLTILLLFCFVY